MQDSGMISSSYGGTAMKKILPLMMKCIFLFVLLVAFVPAWGSGLIEPTRTLKGSGNEMGKLSVYSEPPGLQVMMDGTEIGSTPVIEVDVKPGTHLLKINESETEIYIVPGEPLYLSWHKGSFMEIQKKVSAEQVPSQTDDTKKTEKKKKTEPAKKQVNDGFYWPLNPRGPIY